MTRTTTRFRLGSTRRDRLQARPAWTAAVAGATRRGHCRSADRNINGPGDRHNDLGFRASLVLADK